MDLLLFPPATQVRLMSERTAAVGIELLPLLRCCVCVRVAHSSLPPCAVPVIPGDFMEDAGGIASCFLMFSFPPAYLEPYI